MIAGEHAVRRLAPALVVHETDRDVRLGGDAREFGATAEAGDVVEHVRTGLKCRARDLRLVCVDADHGIGQGMADAFDHRKYARDLFLRRELVEAGFSLVLPRARRLPAHIEDVGAFVDEAPRVFDGRLRLGNAVAGERLR